MNEYEKTRRLVYGDENATFIPVCDRCGRFVKPDETVYFTDRSGLSQEPNATCSKCGRTHMLFEGFL